MFFQVLFIFSTFGGTVQAGVINTTMADNNETPKNEFSFYFK